MTQRKRAFWHLVHDVCDNFTGSENNGSTVVIPHTARTILGPLYQLDIDGLKYCIPVCLKNSSDASVHGTWKAPMLYWRHHLCREWNSKCGHHCTSVGVWIGWITKLASACCMLLSSNLKDASMVVQPLFEPCILSHSRRVALLQGVLLHPDGEVRAPGHGRGYQEPGRHQRVDRLRALQGPQPPLQPQQPDRGQYKLIHKLFHQPKNISNLLRLFESANTTAHEL